MEGLIGATVVQVRRCTEQEMEDNHWETGEGRYRPICIELSSGAVLYAQEDEENNGPGVMVAQGADKTTFSYLFEHVS
jgi:hypothetical protein